MLNKNRITGKIAVNYRRGTGMQITVKEKFNIILNNFKL
jgi:hypothetical protein